MIKLEAIRECLIPSQVAELACEHGPGDLVEIGLGNGEGTANFLQVAQRHARRVIGIDHYGNDMPSSYSAPYSAGEMQRYIQRNAQGCTHLLCHHKCSSLSAEAEEAVNCDLAFAYVDGLQYKRAVISDLELVRKAPVIVVDDWNRDTEMSQVPRAVDTWTKTRDNFIGVQFGAKHGTSKPRYIALIAGGAAF